MPREDRPVQVASLGYKLTGSPNDRGLPFEMGAVGEAVELLAVHYHVADITAANAGYIYFALSSKASTASLLSHAFFFQTHDFYGVHCWQWALSPNGINWISNVQIQSAVVPLYGIIRPRRQMWHIRILAVSIPYIRMEVYYRPVELPREELDLLNRKYGLYRRT